MARAAAAFLLVALPLVAAILAPGAGAQTAPAIPGYLPPTEKDVRLGALNVTTWVMRDPRSLTYGADLSNPLAALFNTSITAGSTGLFYVRGFLADNTTGPRTFRASVRSDSPDVVFQPPGTALNGSYAGANCELTEGGAAMACDLTAGNATGDATFEFAVAAAAQPGPTGVHAHLESWAANATAPEATQDIDYNLTLLDPVPPYAVHQAFGDTTVAAWVISGLRGLSESGLGCLAGASAPQAANLLKATPGGLCVLAFTRSAQDVKVNVSVAAPTWATVTASTWESAPFNRSSGGSGAPVTTLTFEPSTDAPAGNAQLAMHVVVSEEANGTWTQVGQGDLAVPFSVGAAAPVKGPPQVNWLATLPVLVVTGGGLGYLAYKNRAPRLELRSQALRSEQEQRKKRRGEEPGSGGGAQQAVTAEQVAQQRQEVQEAAWDKKRKILEAKREDILKSIRIAEERHQRGEITDHVLKGIRERKERQLEQVEKEMEELR